MDSLIGLCDIPEICSVLISHSTILVTLSLTVTCKSLRRSIYQIADILTLGSKTTSLRVALTEDCLNARTLIIKNVTVRTFRAISSILVKLGTDTIQLQASRLSHLTLDNVELKSNPLPYLQNLQSLRIEQCNLRLSKVSRLIKLQTLEIIGMSYEHESQVDLSGIQLTRLEWRHAGGFVLNLPISLVKLNVGVDGINEANSVDLSELTRLTDLTLWSQLPNFNEPQMLIPLASKLTRLETHSVLAIFPENKSFSLLEYQYHGVESPNLLNPNLNHLTQLTNNDPAGLLETYPFCANLREFVSLRFLTNQDPEALLRYSELRSIRMQSQTREYPANITRLYAQAIVPDNLELRSLEIYGVHSQYFPKLACLTNLTELGLSFPASQNTVPDMIRLSSSLIELCLSRDGCFQSSTPRYPTPNYADLTRLRRLTLGVDMTIPWNILTQLSILSLDEDWNQSIVDRLTECTRLTRLELNGDIVSKVNLSELSRLVNLEYLHFGGNIDHDMLRKYKLPECIVPITNVYTGF